MLEIIVILIILFIYLNSKQTPTNKTSYRRSYKRKSKNKSIVKRRTKKFVEYISPEEKGKKAERRVVSKLSTLGIEKENIFKDLYIDKLNGEYAQIDVVMLTDIGIFVFEVKNYSGWIFGDGSQRNWMQILNYGESKNQFYNPIFQNQNHLIALKESLPQLAKVPLFSIIVFDGDCELKKFNNIPQGIQVLKIEKLQALIKLIIKRRKLIEYDKDELKTIFKKAVKNSKNQGIREEHIDNINLMLQKKIALNHENIEDE